VPSPPLDAATHPWKFTAMQRLWKITSFLLLAIWLPATLHCDLEAAGFAESHHTDCCAVSHDCKTDACATVESSLIRETAPALHLVAPSPNTGFLFLLC